MIELKRFIGNWWGLGAFIFITVWTVVAALRTEQSYQDSWMLEGLWLPFAILLMIYLLNVSLSSNLQYVAILSTAITFLLYAVPALKYTLIYDSTIDNAVHMSLMRLIATTGQVDPSSSYAATPGFHILIAILAELSSLPVEAWTKVIPAFVGSLTPLAFYILCKRVLMPATMAKITIILAGFSWPLFYTLSGTHYTMPVFIFILSLLFLREMDKSNNLGVSYTILLLLFIAQIIFWHPISSLLVPIIIILAGILARLDYKDKLFLEQSKHLPFLGIFGIIGAISYWMYGAGFVWKKFVQNISQALLLDLTSDIIPRRLSEIPLADRVLIALFSHARDGILVALALVGLILLFKKINYPDQFTRLFELMV